MRTVLTNLDRRWLSAASRDLSRELVRLCDNELGGAVDHVLVWAAHFPGEVDLSNFIEAQSGRRTVYMPRALPDRTMEFISVGSDWRATAVPGFQGIPEPDPATGAIYDAALVDRTAVIVPGLAFDSAGGRLGRGGGYYDRFLGRSSMQGVVTIGVCWALQIVDAVPTEAHDAAMDWVCHERGYYRCGGTPGKGAE